jgi:hypothetical protein
MSMVPSDISFQASHFKPSISPDGEQQLPLFSMPTSAAAPAHDPGGKVRLSLKAGVISTVKFGGENQE